jgi:hypothetical protein
VLHRLVVLAVVASFVACNKTPQPKDVWTLQKESVVTPGEWHSVALFYGYDDDYSACLDVVTALKESQSASSYSASYRCIPGDARE